MDIYRELKIRCDPGFGHLHRVEVIRRFTTHNICYMFNY